MNRTQPVCVGCGKNLVSYKLDFCYDCTMDIFFDSCEPVMKNLFQPGDKVIVAETSYIVIAVKDSQVFVSDADYRPNGREYAVTFWADCREVRHETESETE